MCRYLPGEAEFREMEKIATLFLGMQVDLLTQFIQEEISLDKDRLFHCLKTISSFIVGRVPFL